MRTHGNSPRLFDNGLLERLSHVHPLTPLLLWTPVLGWLLWRSFSVHALGADRVVAWGVAGLLVWTLTEYVVHRFVFHGRGLGRLRFILHGIHHEAPDDATRWLMPPGPAMVGLAILYGFFRMLLDPAVVEPFFALFLGGYLAYDYIHYAVHGGRLSSKLGRYLRRRHLLHHFGDAGGYWGVSSPLWDYVFGTEGSGRRTAGRMPPSPWGGRPPRVGPTALLLMLTLGACLPAGAAGAAGNWETLSDKDDVLIERRAHEGSRLYEVRATMYSRLAPAAIFETIWKQREHPQFVPYLKRLELLSESGDERLTYEQVAVPMARDRDYTVKLSKRVDPEAQRYEVAFVTANEAGPPPDKGHVRVLAIRGRWLIEPGRDGKGSRVCYEVMSEPGGAIPSWVANRVQGETAARLVRAMVQRALDTSGQK